MPFTPLQPEPLRGRLPVICDGVQPFAFLMASVSALISMTLFS